MFSVSKFKKIWLLILGMMYW